jgi:hypothetical protein
MIAVFKTGVRNQGDADYLMKIMENRYPGYEINFDLEDCDHVLRIKGQEIKNKDIIALFRKEGFICTELK